LNPSFHSEAQPDDFNTAVAMADEATPYRTQASTPEDNDPASDTNQEERWERGIRPHPELIGTWCVVEYERNPYPGIIQVCKYTCKNKLKQEM